MKYSNYWISQTFHSVIRSISGGTKLPLGKTASNSLLGSSPLPMALEIRSRKLAPENGIQGFAFSEICTCATRLAFQSCQVSSLFQILRRARTSPPPPFLLLYPHLPHQHVGELLIQWSLLSLPLSLMCKMKTLFGKI